MNFLLGCNYWASNAGTEMWQNFDVDCIEKDLRILSEHGVNCMRVFPNWRDFQPVMPHYAACGEVAEYCLPDGKENPYYLDETMLDRFAILLELCKKYHIQVIIGLLTGWMSGGLFIPTALYGKNLITDPLAQYFEQLFIKGFIDRFKDDESIYAWDLGNECNCMSTTGDRWQAAAWTAMTASAIRAADPTRPVISGMHGLHLDRGWTIADQAMFTDMLTTHPYPYFVKHGKVDALLSYRTTLLATAQNKFYAEIGNKPCLAEEVGTLGPMLCSNEKAGDYLRVNLFSLWANGAPGVLWWCASDQTMLTTHPYTQQMNERELGMLDAHHQPKPVLKEMDKFSMWMQTLDFELPPASDDAVCILTKGQRDWGVGYMTYALMRKLGLNLTFADGSKQLPDAPVYLLPSVKGDRVMPLNRYQQLKEKVEQGADVFLSLDDCFLSEFETFTGLKIIDSYEARRTITAQWDGAPLTLTTARTFITCPTSARVLLSDQDGYPLFAVNQYGKGRVFTLLAPMEDGLLDRHDALSGNEHLLYHQVMQAHISPRPLTVENAQPAITYHYEGKNAYVVMLNHNDQEIHPLVQIGDGYEICQIYYGDLNTIPPFDACVVKLIQK